LSFKDENHASDLSKEFISRAEKITDSKSAFEFIKKFGTHYVQSAKMGARHEKFTIFTSDISSEDMKSIKETAKKASAKMSISAESDLVGSVKTGYGYSST